MQGTIPYLGTFLTDLVMLDTAMKDYLEVGWLAFLYSVSTDTFLATFTSCVDFGALSVYITFIHSYIYIFLS